MATGDCWHRAGWGWTWFSRQGKQAKVLTPRQEAVVLRQLEASLSVKAGLRAKEVAELTHSGRRTARRGAGETL